MQLKVNGISRICLVCIENDLKERRDVIPNGTYYKTYLEEALERAKAKKILRSN